MLRYIVRRLGNIVVVLFGMTVFVFLLLRMAPGSPVYLLVGEMATPAEVARLEHELGLDLPLHVQYVNFIKDIGRGNLGTSIIYRTPAANLVLERLPATIELALCATLFSVCVALPLGILKAIRRGGLVDHAGTLITMSGVSVPSFWLGIMLIIIFSVGLGWTATSGRASPLFLSLLRSFDGDFGPLRETLRRLVLPMVTLGAFQMALLSRLTRSSILEELSHNYVRAARARGLPRYLVISKHALRNALLPVITVLGLEVGSLIGGAVITEAVFAWPGVGQLIYQAVSGRDYTLAQAGILLIGGFVVMLTFLVDLSYGIIDPRIRYG